MTTPAAGIADLQKSSSGAWYASYAIPTVPPPTASAYTFNSKPLEAQVYTHASFNPGWGAPQPPDNSSLTWLGAPIIMSLSSLAVTAVYPNLPTSQYTDLRAAVTSKPVHAQLCRMLSLEQNLHTSTPAVLGSDKVLAELFEAYIAGLSRDLGLGRFDDLYRYYFALIEPFLLAYHALYTQHLSTPVAPTKDKRRQELAPYTSRLMEYAAKNKLEPPKFEFHSNGAQGSEIKWSCLVMLGGTQVARGVASSKLEAKHIASAEAMQALPVVGENPAIAAQRRKRKELFRQKNRGRGGGGGGVTADPASLHQTLPIGPAMPAVQHQPQLGIGMAMQMPFAPPPGTT